MQGINFGDSGLGLEFLMNHRKASVDGMSQASSPPPSVAGGPPSVRSIRMSHPPPRGGSGGRGGGRDNESVVITVDDLDESSGDEAPGPGPGPQRRTPHDFQAGFDGYRARSATPSERSFGGINDARPQPIGSGGGGRYHERLSQDEILDRKREILYQLDRLEKRGVKLPRRYTLATPLEEMQNEYERIKRDRELDSSIQFQKRMLMAAVTGIEFLNNRFDPLDIKLNGWSQSFHDGLEDYNECCEELAEKYRGKGKIAPELKMLMMVSGSAFMFHLQNRYFKSMPGLDQVFSQNPDLMRQFAGAAMNTAAQQSAANGDAGGAGFANILGDLFGGAPSMPAGPTQRMRGPRDVDDLLRDLEQQQTAVPGVEVQSVADSDESLQDLLRATGAKGGISLDLDV